MNRFVWGILGIVGSILIVPAIAYARDQMVTRLQEQDEGFDLPCCVSCGEPFESRDMGTMCPTCRLRSEHRP